MTDFRSVRGLIDLRSFGFVLSLVSMLLVAFVTMPAVQATSHKLSIMALKGLDAVNLDVAIGKDAKATLKYTGSHPGAMRGALAQIVKERLELVGIKVVSRKAWADAKSNTSFLVKVGLDHNANVYLKLSVKEKASLVRSPENVLSLTTWSLVQDPRSNENGPIEDTAGKMTDIFVAEYLQANPDKQK